ncbi:hypothetical protein IQ07DRAFT_601259 [Pyrenochaeta sp. DS3sAY3a]|nr:hypothetical protein IQ07DRAFT_601259 [Pyrenochaeta sp. DS3sAY3a]
MPRVILPSLLSFQYVYGSKTVTLFCLSRIAHQATSNTVQIEPMHESRVGPGLPITSRCYAEAPDGSVYAALATVSQNSKELRGRRPLRIQVVSSNSGQGLAI